MAKRTILTLAILAVAACAENEDACYEKLSSDFEQYAERSSASGDHDGALAARQSALAIALIWTDDDRSACDYVSAGPDLQRK